MSQLERRRYLGISVIKFLLLDNPSILRKLREELREVIPDPEERVQVEKLERLYYLAVCIQEGLRLCYSLSARLPRISPDCAGGI